MRKKRPRIGAPDEVRITREGESALIEFADTSIARTSLSLGPRIRSMSDLEILECYNEAVRAQEHSRATYEHLAIEIPVGKPQIQYEAQCHQWTPRGDVLRCVIEDDENGDPVIHIDEQELTWEEFGGLIRTYAGWGMRIKFVPDDSTHEEPVTEVREPKLGER
jgi:hypothetical protein